MMREKYVMALDQGTTSARCILYDRQGRQGERGAEGIQADIPSGRLGGARSHGYLVHSDGGVAQEAMLKVDVTSEDIDSIGITNQRETTVVWDRETGEPVYNAIVWQCRRTAGFCDQLKRQGLEDMIKSRTGLLIDPYFSATKLRWILENVDGARQRAEAGQLLFGTIETWLIWRLTGGKVHITDYSNASRTMMFNIHTLRWDEDILRVMGIPACMLPEPRPSSMVYGESHPRIFGGARYLYRVLREISSRLCLVRHASRRARRRTPMGPVDSCWSIRG